jgi:hypothetical protein
MLPLVLCFGHSAAKFAKLNVYSLIPGNWTYHIGSFEAVCPIVPFLSEISPNGTNITHYRGEHKGTTLEITAWSNLTGFVQFGSRSFSFAFSRERDLISYSECEVSDGTHLSITAYSDVSLEVVIVPAGSHEITAIGLHKPEIEQTWKDYIVPGLLALAVTIVIRKYCSK